MDAGDLAGSITFACRGRARAALGRARPPQAPSVAGRDRASSRSPPSPTSPRGFDVEEAVGSVALLVALLRLRGRFDVPGDPTSLRPLVAGLAVALVAWAIVGSAASEHLNRITDLGFELVLAAGAFWALHHWLRAHREPVRADRRRPRPRPRARRRSRPGQPVVLRAPRATAATSSRGPATRFWPTASSPAARSSPAIRSDLPTRCPASSTTSRASAASAAGGWSCCTPPTEWLDAVPARGMRAFAIGDEAVLDPTRFSLEGRGDAQGAPVGHPAASAPAIAFRVVAPDDLSEAQRADVDARHARVARRSRRARASRWRWMICTPTNRPGSRSPSTATAACAASSTSCRRRAATRSRRCVAAERRRTASWSS